jgi:integrase
MAAKTFGSIKVAYLDWHRASKRPKTHEHASYALNKLFAHWDAVPVHEITREMVADRLDGIVKENGPYASNRARACLGAMFNFAIMRGKANVNPVAATMKPHVEKRRERVLTDAELAAIWAAAGDGAYGRIVRLLMLTGLRRREIGAMRWSWLKDGALHVPAGFAKTDVPSVTPLVPEALALIETMPRMWPPVWGSTDEGFVNWSERKERLDARIAKMTGKPLAPWTLHDLRRTLATSLARRFGVRLEVIKAVINHAVVKGADAAYIIEPYPAEKREALERWAAFIGGLVTGKVMSLAA